MTNMITIKEEQITAYSNLNNAANKNLCFCVRVSKSATILLQLYKGVLKWGHLVFFKINTALIYQRTKIYKNLFWHNFL